MVWNGRAVKRIRFYYAAVRALVAGMIATAGVSHAQDSSIELSLEDRLWMEARAQDTPDAYQRYLEAFPAGRFASEAFRRIIEEGDEAAPEPGAGPGVVPLSPEAANELY